MSKILKVKARQVFDSRGNPTIESEIFTKNNSAKAICPSGASTGTYEAFEKRDINNKRYLGKSVLGAVNLVKTKISRDDHLACEARQFLRPARLPSLQHRLRQSRILIQEPA